MGCQLVLAQVSTGTISGVVQDNTGAVIPNASVVVRNADTGISRTLTTDAAGRYQALNLNPGNYEVEGQVSGFQTEIRRGIVITVGRQAVVNLALQVGAVTETVEVTGEAPLIETRTSTLGALVNQTTIESMPLNGRSWDQLALLQTGITPYSGGTGKSFGDSQGQKFSVAGSRSYSNSFLLDGTDINGHGNSTPGGASGTNMGVDAIREFQVITNAFAAEHGRATGAVVSAITKSGTNQFHGSVFEFFRNDELDAAEYGFYDDPANDIVARPPFVQNQFGGTIGGPIKRDRTFFLAAFEALRRRRGEPNVPIVPSADGHIGIQGRNPDGTPISTTAINPRIRPFLDLYPTANDPDSVSLFNNGLGFFIHAPSVSTNQNYVLGRIDHQINDSHSIFGRYAFDQDTVTNPGGTYGITGFTTEQASRKQYITAQVNSIISPTVLNHFTIAFNRTGQFEDELPTNELGPEFSFVPGLPMGLITVGGQIATASNRGLANLGTDNTFPRLYYYNLFEYGDAVSVIRGSHTMKFGGNLKRMRDNSALNTTLRGRYSFSSYTNFLRGNSNRLDFVIPANSPLEPRSVGHAYRGLRQWFIAGYAQDDWQLSPRLTLNLGLRYETVTNPKEANELEARLIHITDPSYSIRPTIDSYFDIAKKTFQPRFGFAYQLNDNASTVIRGGAGIFHDQPLPHLYSTQVEKYPPYYNLVNARAPLSLTPDDLVKGTPDIRINGVAPSIKMGTKYHWNVTIQQQIGQNNVVEIGYVGSKAHSLPKFNELNTPIPVILADGRECFGFRTAAQQASGTGSDNPLCPSATSDRLNSAFSELRTIEYVGQALYNGMQLKFTRRSTAGQFQFLYTWSRAMDNASTTASGDLTREPQSSLNPRNANQDYARASFDAVNNFGINYTYPIPYRGEGVMGAVLGGWEVAGITTIVSGSPYTIRTGGETDRNQDGGRGDRPDLLPGFSNNPTEGTSAGCGPIESGPIGRSVKEWNKTSRWHDICAFGITEGIYGNLGRNTLLGPGRLNFDFSLHKNFPVTEGMDLQFRAEMFNIFNRNNLGLPENVGFAGLEPEPSAGTILPGETVTRPREIQFGLKLVF
jgi:outer membrane receptor protein involved in Fe transport